MKLRGVVSPREEVTLRRAGRSLGIPQARSAPCARSPQPCQSRPGMRVRDSSALGCSRRQFPRLCCKSRCPCSGCVLQERCYDSMYDAVMILVLGQCPGGGETGDTRQSYSPGQSSQGAETPNGSTALIWSPPSGAELPRARADLCFCTRWGGGRTPDPRWGPWSRGGTLRWALESHLSLVHREGEAKRAPRLSNL